MMGQQPIIVDSLDALPSMYLKGELNRVTMVALEVIVSEIKPKLDMVTLIGNKIRLHGFIERERLDGIGDNEVVKVTGIYHPPSSYGSPDEFFRIYTIRK